MTKKFILLSTVLLAVACCSGCSVNVPQPKPYEVAAYEVYSDLLHQQPSWWERLIFRRPVDVLIRVETEPGQDRQANTLVLLPKDERLKQAVDEAASDYVKWNGSVLQLKREFDLPRYDLITTAEEQAVLKDEGKPQAGSGCWQFTRNHPGYYRWVELSAVGFNKDQTVAVVYIVEWDGRAPLCEMGIFGTGGYRMLQKQGGWWRLIESRTFSDWTT